MFLTNSLVLSLTCVALVFKRICLALWQIFVHQLILRVRMRMCCVRVYVVRLWGVLRMCVCLSARACICVRVCRASYY